MSLRWKLTLWYAVTIAAILSAFVGADIYGLARNLQARVDQTLQAGGERFLRALEHLQNPSDSSTLEQIVRDAFPERTVFLQLDPQDAREPAVATASLGAARFPSPQPQDFATSAVLTATLSGLPGELRVLSFAAKDGTGRGWWVRVAASRGDVAMSLQEALWEHGLLALLTILGVATVGHFVIGRTLRPVKEMVQLANTITAEDLSRRIGITSKDEIGELGDTLDAMIARLERSFLHMGQFATVVAHELNTPLATLKGELELMQRRERSAEEYRSLLPRLQTQIERLSSLVENLLLLSRMEAQSKAFEFRPEQLDQIVLETFEDYESLAREAGVKLELDIPEHAIVPGERALLKQLVSNLAANAIRYTDSGGKVALQVTATDAGVELRVTDTGRGIPEEALPHVCEPFYRAEAIRTAAASGVGLGLAIVRRVGDLHGCTLRFDSKLGQGTTVTVTWPRELGIGN